MVQELKPLSEKIQEIAKECEEAGASKWETAKIIKALEETETNARKLRKKAIEELIKLNPEAANVLASFTKMQVFTSKEWLEAFDRGNIIKSLLKETTVSRTIAEKIGFEVEDKLKDLKVSYLNTAIIREMVNVKLLEYGHEAIHSQYSRLGLPVSEAKKFASEGKTSTQFVFREMNWLNEIPKEIRKQHFQGKLFLHFPQDFSSKVFGIGFNAETNAENQIELISGLIQETTQNSIKSSNFPTINSINFVIANALKENKKKNESKITAKSFIKLIESFAETRQPGNPAMLSIDLFSGKNEWKESKEKAIEFGKELIEAALKGKTKFVCRLQSTYQAKLLNPIKGVFLDCREKEFIPVTENVFSEKGTALNFIEANLVFLALEAEKKEAVFEQLLEESMEAVKEANEKKFSLLMERNYLQELNINEASNAISFWGKREAAGLIGLNEQELNKMLSKKINTINSRESNAIIQGICSEKAAKKFSESVSKEFKIQIEPINSKEKSFQEFQERIQKEKLVQADF